MWEAWWLESISQRFPGTISYKRDAERDTGLCHCDGLKANALVVFRTVNDSLLTVHPRDRSTAWTQGV